MPRPPRLKGLYPIRRTWEYLKSGNIVFKDNVKIMLISSNTYKESEFEGIRDLVFFELPKIQYKNPHVQINTFRNLTPTPYLQFFLTNGEKVIVDVFNKTSSEILEHVRKVFGKSDVQLKHELVEHTTNPANFGKGYLRNCICDVPGQVPCPSVTPLSEEKRFKFRDSKDPPWSMF